jgi:hypothetical protein
MVLAKDNTFRACPTTFLAMEEAIKWGAKKIRLFGADMEGPWESNLGVNVDLGASPFERMQQRWDYERYILDGFTKAAAEKGIHIERIMPDAEG